jgi:protoheme IX farnesyltransferase
VSATTRESTLAVGWRARLGAFFALTKPRIIELLLVTTVPAMVLAARRWPGTGLVLATLIGGTLSAAGANALNCYFDRDIDEIMRRTARRPLPRHRVSPRSALIFGVLLGVAGFLWLWVFTNIVAAAISTAALVFYVLVYTRWLKRTTDQNIVIGGAAGAAPALVGWAAVQGSLGLSAWVLFGIVFYWTPPHFWALALRYQADYASAAVPMMPVVRGTAPTTTQMLLYAALTGLTSLLLVPVAGMGWIYLLASVILGAVFIWETWLVHRDPGRAMLLFMYSTRYLALLFGAVMLDILV